MQELAMKYFTQHCAVLMLTSPPLPRVEARVEAQLQGQDLSQGSTLLVAGWNLSN